MTRSVIFFSWKCKVNKSSFVKYWEEFYKYYIVVYTNVDSSRVVLSIRQYRILRKIVPCGKKFKRIIRHIGGNKKIASPVLVSRSRKTNLWAHPCFVRNLSYISGTVAPLSSNTVIYSWPKFTPK